MPIRILKLQGIAVVALAVIAWFFGGSRAAISTVLGGAGCVIPNALFVARLMLAARRPGGASPASFFAGELLKVGSTVLLLFGAAVVYRGMAWPWFIAGVVVALKGYFLTLLWPGRARNRPSGH